MRIIKIEGELNGHKFKVKSESFLSLKIDKEIKQDLKKWQEENNKEFNDFVGKYEKQIASGDFDSIPDFPENKDWRFDEEFRAKRYEKMATHAMDFEDLSDKELKKLCASEQLEYGVIEEAWDFFVGRRRAPSNISAR